MMKTKKINSLSGGFFLLLLFILAVFFSGMKGDRSIVSIDNKEDKLFIEVSGDVKNPGIYGFEEDARLYDILERAGCEAAEVLLANGTSSTELHSGLKIEIHREGGRIFFKQDEMSSHHKITLNIPISLNNESMDGLTAIPGIGPSLSGRIVEERRKNGGFRDLRQLKELPGVGDKLYDKIVPYLKL